MMRRGPPPEPESSSDEEDAFSKLSAKNKKKKDKKESSSKGSSTASDAKAKPTESTTAPAIQLPVSTTSSMKRHHGKSNDMRKAKMHSLLMELEAEKSRKVINQYDRGRGFVPEKKGSFVDPDEEHLTTNIFVGNLAPSITEEELTDLFRQFGDLYSVKIMWPRTPEERTRNRNTGFVCFMKREDAEDAMQCDETDPFNAGRRIMMRWGKNVKKIIRKGTGGVAVAPIRKRAAPSASTQHAESSSYQTSTGSNPFSAIPTYDEKKHGEDAVHVVMPEPAARAHFIATVASYVAKDGDVLERKLIELEYANPKFAFLSMPNNTGEAIHARDQKKKQEVEHIFYRWRVYAFCQGDGFNVWRTEPFMMIRPNGFFWIPPAINQEAARKEEEDRKMREEDIAQQKKKRRRITTGRQLEQARKRGLAGAADGGAKLTREEADEFNLLVRKQLTASRETVCAAMAFCFEKSGAMIEIARLLKEVLLEDEISNPGISVETRIARLYLLSDVLFNSQQPGVRNAFKYRDSVERMAPDVFTSLGKHGRGSLGRMTRNKLSNAVSAVLGAWTNWSVYNPAFMDELHDRYEGKEIKKVEAEDEKPAGQAEEVPKEEDVNANAVKIITAKQRQDWTAVGDEQAEAERAGSQEDKDTQENSNHVAEPTKDTEGINGISEGRSMSAEAPTDNEDDIDGEPLEEGDLDVPDDDLDGEPLEEGDIDSQSSEEVGPR